MKRALIIGRASNPHSGADVPMARGWQNEAKTKPKCEVAQAINGLIKFVKRPVLWGHAEFWGGLRPKAVSQAKLQNEAIHLRQGYGAIPQWRDREASRTGNQKQVKPPANPTESK